MSLWSHANASRRSGVLAVPDDTGEDPACLACGKAMAVAAVDERGDESSFITFRCLHCGRTEKFLCE